MRIKWLHFVVVVAIADCVRHETMNIKKIQIIKLDRIGRAFIQDVKYCRNVNEADRLWMHRTITGCEQTKVLLFE